MAIYALGDSTPSIHPDAFVHPQATVIGNVTIGADSSIWPQAVLRGDFGSITVGRRTSIQDGAAIHCTGPHSTVIGDDCVIGHLVHMEGCIIENGCLIGTNSVVLPRAIVRTGSLVAASAFVPNDMEVPSGALAVGIPAKLRLDAVDAQAILDGAQTYVDNAARYRSELRRID